MRRPLSFGAAVAALALVLTGCTGDGGSRDAAGPADRGAGSASAGSGSSGPSTPSAPAPPPPPPEDGCYRIPFSDLGKPTNSRDPVDCDSPHDAQTFHVGELDLVVDGHLLAVDSDRVVNGLQETCDRRLAQHVGGTAQERRLTMLRAVWFAPSLEQAYRGARWYRCDLVALAGGDRLLRLPVPGKLRGVLDRPAGASYAMCGTAAPGAPDFRRVICARRHAWRAVSTLALPRGRAYPGVEAVKSAGDDRCRALVRDLADDPLNFRFGWEWPTREQWQAGQRHGFCWAPD